MLALYYAPHTCALASHIALEDAGAAYELERIDLRQAQQQSAEYLRVHPKARVPALVTARAVPTELRRSWPLSHNPSQAPAWLHSRTLLRSPSCNPSTVTSAQPCTLRTPLG